MRIVTRPDFDGVVCAVLIAAALDVRRPVLWLEPSDVQRGRAGICAGDIIANLPFHPDCEIWIDHHATNAADRPFKGLWGDAPSAARLVLDYFAPRLQRDFSELVAWADRIDSADITRDMVLHPENYDYVLLSMTVSGEDRRDEPYWNRLVGLLREASIRTVREDPEAAERCRRVVAQNARYADILKTCTRMQGHVSISDLRPIADATAGNRFLAYSLFPEALVNIRVRFEAANPDTVVVNIGHSIFNPGCNVHVGKLLAAFGGGGHRGAASARFPAAQAEECLVRIIAALEQNQP
ncbi:MAG: exopolyphosphatase [Desulfobacterales bacterium]|jgi:oligoribonuclease NrnB/cAMP/cGMP phosphodiesterase (DHH superfamily)|nr:exopolyphosphatase [Desulfobacterales bacterium]